MTPFSRNVVAAVAAGAVLLTAGAGIALAADSSTDTRATAATSATPPPAVEDFSYPGADRILAEKGIKLISGDGHITLAECGAAPGQLEVWSRSRPKFCFQVTGKGGYLALEVPKVYGFMGNSYDTQIDMTVANEKKSFDIEKDAWVQVGEAADPKERDHTLVEIRSSK
ncbi:hypothetical protein ACIGXM_03400 [Kitasatospora sp. NPDC052896]|uniref:hypothetical protein n=1 Tax=Kitasatospora sp. NPDC052896 TaxID=3364061 RepID=UPI0037C6EDAD